MIRYSNSHKYFFATIMFIYTQYVDSAEPDDEESVSARTAAAIFLCALLLAVAIVGFIIYK